MQRREAARRDRRSLILKEILSTKMAVKKHPTTIKPVKTARSQFWIIFDHPRLTLAFKSSESLSRQV